MSANKKGELAKQILLAFGSGLMLTTAILLPGSAVMFAPLLKKFKVRKQSFVRSLKVLKRDRLIDFRECGNVCKITVTDKGKKKILFYNLDDLKIKTPKKWDRIWRIVTFDIPEKKRPARDALRSKLNELGFYQLNKSVFIHPYHCLDEIQFIEEVFNVGVYVNYIEVNKIEGGDWLKEKFGL